MHRLTFEIPEEYIDHYDHVNHGKYFTMYEKAQQDFLRERGADFEDLERDYAIRFIQRALRIEYIRSLILKDIVDISTSIKSVGTSSFTFEQKIERDGKVVSECETVYVAIDFDGEKSTIHSKIKDALLS